MEDADAIEKLMNQNETTPVPAEDSREMHALLYKLLDQIPEQQRSAIVLRDLEDVPYEKMAEIMKCSEQAARLKVFRARARLRDLMEKTLRRKERAVRKQ